MGRHRLWILLLVLAGVAGLVVFDPLKEPVKVAALAVPTRGPALREAAAGNARPANKGESQLLLIRPRTPLQDGPAEAFPIRDWTPPPPPPLPPPPPPPPQAPPLPFQVVGKQLEGSQWVVFLARQERTYMVRAGDDIEGTYRVDTVVPPVMTLTYLPLKQQQTLTIGNSQ